MSAIRKDPAMIRSNFERVGADFYATPEWVTEALLKVWQPRGNVVWECAVGSGNMARPLLRAGYQVIASDYYEEGAYPEEAGRWPNTFIEDFFLAPARCPVIVTNPPYSMAVQFIRRALELTAPTSGQTTMLLRNEFDSASTRQDLFGRCPFFAGKVVLTKRPYWSAERTASPRHNYSWFIWDHTHFGEPWLRYTR